MFYLIEWLVAQTAVHTEQLLSSPIKDLGMRFKLAADREL
jgi:hypothetical protein